MRSLFLKIFLWFWATVIVTGISLVLTFMLEPRSVPSRWHASLEDTARYAGLVAIEEAEVGGAARASAYIDRLESDTRQQACLFDSAGGAIAGKGCGSFEDMISRVSASTSLCFQHEIWHRSSRFAVAGRERPGIHFCD